MADNEEKPKSNEDLGAFGAAEHADDESADAQDLRPMLVFVFDGASYGVRLSDVDSVIPWRDPDPVPQSPPILNGVIQDHGRIIAVLRHPSGGEPGKDDKSISRIIVCDTRRGLLGLPAAATSHVGPVAVHAEPTHGEVVDTEAGVLTYIEARALASVALDGS